MWTDTARGWWLAALLIVLAGTPGAAQSAPAPAPGQPPATPEPVVPPAAPAPGQAPAPTPEPDLPPEALPADAESAEEAAAAEEAATSNVREGFSLTLTGGAGRDEGLRVDGEEITDDVYWARPSLVVSGRPTPRSLMTLAYEPEFVRFAEHSELDDVDHVAGARLDHAYTRRSRMFVGGSYLRGEDASRFLGGSLLLFPRVLYRQTRAFAGYEHRWRETRFEAEVEHAETFIDAAAEELWGGLDQTEERLSLTADRDVGEATTLTGTYSVVFPDGTALVDVGPVFGEPLALADDPLHSATLGLRLAPTELTTLSFAGGALYDGDEATWIGAGELLARGEKVHGRLRYDRSQASLGAPFGTAGSGPVGTGSGVLRGAVTQTLSAGFGARLAQRLGWDGSVWTARTDLPDDQRVESLAASSRLVLQAARRLGLFAEVEYLDQEASGETGTAELFGADQLTRTRYSVGLIVGLALTREDPGVLDEPEQRALVLPERRGAQ